VVHWPCFGDGTVRRAGEATIRDKSYVVAQTSPLQRPRDRQHLLHPEDTGRARRFRQFRHERFLMSSGSLAHHTHGLVMCGVRGWAFSPGTSTWAFVPDHDHVPLHHITSDDCLHPKPLRVEHLCGALEHAGRLALAM
jgi:hypothetical protein